MKGCIKMEILTFIMLFAVILTMGVFVWQNKHTIEALRSDNKDLLNRLMAKDYKEYATFEHVKSVAEVETVAKTIMNDQDVFQVD